MVKKRTQHSQAGGPSCDTPCSASCLELSLRTGADTRGGARFQGPVSLTFSLSSRSRSCFTLSATNKAACTGCSSIPPTSPRTCCRPSGSRRSPWGPPTCTTSRSCSGRQVPPQPLPDSREPSPRCRCACGSPSEQGLHDCIVVPPKK